MGLIINMGALTLSQLLENAQDKGIDLELEVSEAENQVLLDSIEKLSLESIPKNMRRGIDALVISYSHIIFLKFNNLYF